MVCVNHQFLVFYWLRSVYISGKVSNQSNVSAVFVSLTSSPGKNAAHREIMCVCVCM